MKKFTLTFACLVILLIGTMSAQAPLGIHFDSGEVLPGDTINLQLKTTGFQNLLSAQFSINWNPDVFEFISTQDYNPDINDLNEYVLGDFPGNTDDGIITFIWLDYLFSGVSVPDTSVIVSFDFKAVGQNCDTTNFRITNTPREISVFNIEEDSVDLISTSGLWKIDQATSTSALNSEIETLVVSPNPVASGGQIRLTWSGSQDQSVDLKLYSTDGSLLTTVIVDIINNQILYTPDVTLGEGSYFINLTGKESQRKAVSTIIVK